MTSYKIISITFFSTLLLNYNVLALSDETGHSLCTKNEDIYFTCQLEGEHKIVSICATGNMSPESGYVQYRYGDLSKISFEYPALRLPPRNLISVIDISRLAEGIGTHLKFKNDGYEYVISNALIPGEVYVVKNEKVIFNRICNGNAYIPFPKKVAVGVRWGSVEKVDAMDGH